MDFCIIPPIHHLDLMLEGDMILALPFLYKNHEYKNFIDTCIDKGWRVIMDNGAAEKNLNVEDLFNLYELDLYEIVAPDVLFDARNTLIETERFVSSVTRKGALIMGVAQGNTCEEWLMCYREMLADSRIDTIGFSKRAVARCFVGAESDQGIMEGRHACFDFLKERDLLLKPIHLLGAGDPREFRHYDNHPMIRSNDTCNWILSGMHSIKFMDNVFTRIKTPEDYFTYHLCDDQLRAAINNIKWIKNNYGKID